MCGISGIVANSAERFMQVQKNMVATMHHRGPDGNGIYLFDNCILGHNRLSIVDLESGNQPMLNNKKNIGIVFNGEIYGYQSIRKKLPYNYQTTSDTEVILALYEKYGYDMLSHLPGMFAFGIWDNDKQRLFAGRDRFGEKPFFYALTSDNELIFASEIKAICASGLIKPELDLTSVSRYLNRGYVGPLKTIYKNIFSLPPAHYLIYRQNKLTISRYWNFPSTTQDNLTLSDAAEKFESLFANAVKKQMVADVEVSAFLSGGLDSTSVVSVASKANPLLKTLAFGYKNEFNELPFAKLASDAYQTEHHELYEEGTDLEELFLMLPDTYDEPFSDSSAVATYLICKAASKYGKVVLTGDGGDELLGGYTWRYKPIVNDIKARNTGIGESALVFALAVAEKIKEKTRASSNIRTWRDKHISINNSKLYDNTVDIAINNLNNNNINRLLGLPAPEPFECFWQQDNTINDALKVDLADYMPGDILVKTDRAAMANSLELRSPFLDVDFAEFCISMPGHFKIDTKSDKILLREAMSKYWPDEIKKRGKQGFGVSKSHWEHSEKLKKIYDEYVYNKNSHLYNILPYKESQKLMKQNPGIIFTMLILSVWMNKKYN